MEPHDELAVVKGKSESYIFTLARPGEEYICYVLGDDPVTIELQNIEGSFTACWYDPKGGHFLDSVHRVQGEGRCLFQSPSFKQDIVLYVQRP